MTYIANNWSSILQVAGGCFEIAGALFLANRYLNVPLYQVPRLILRGLRKQKAGGAPKIIYDLSEEFIPLSIRGIFCLCIGFVLQAAPSMVNLIKPIIEE